MKLRYRLYLFSTTQLLVFGGLFALAYLSFERSVIPAFRSLLSAKTEQVTRLVAGELDVPLGADDLALLQKSIDVALGDSELAFLEVRNAGDQRVFLHGHAPADAFGGSEREAHDATDSIRAWATVSLEGLKLGSVALGFTTARFDAIETWARRFAVVATLVWMLALTYSLQIAQLLVRPIRAMMDFSRKVAGGALSERLAVDAPGELRELRDYLNDMTADLERREAERRAQAEHAESMQRELLSVSRMAGMAEIATGVLHNVGNVLNSLNVSVALLGEQVRGSRIGGLCRSIELADGFPGGLPAFLGTEKGKVLPTYLTTVSKRLAEENAKMLEELEAISRYVDHIKTIVTMQQSYARPNGVQEVIGLGALIDDALRMGEASFAKHGIEVVRDYPADLEVVSDRHKLLQIMINLISNARHALKDRAAAPQQLTVRARRTERALMIWVNDTGVGIPSENLDKIFQHGFTTKRGGHGFGLHASANAARELGGSLRAASEGVGHGASFELEIPMPAGERAHDLRN